MAKRRRQEKPNRSDANALRGRCLSVALAKRVRRVKEMAPEGDRPVEQTSARRSRGPLSAEAPGMHVPRSYDRKHYTILAGPLGYADTRGEGRVGRAGPESARDVSKFLRMTRHAAKFPDS